MLNPYNSLNKPKQNNERISADTSILHLSFNHSAVANFDSTYNIKPPLRSEADRIALLQGLQDGVIDTVVFGTSTLLNG